MNNWQDISKAPKDGVFLTGLDKGLFGGRWTWYKTKTFKGRFFNYDTGEEIKPTHFKHITGPDDV